LRASKTKGPFRNSRNRRYAGSWVMGMQDLYALQHQPPASP
jgi:hypothetical protein